MDRSSPVTLITTVYAQDEYGVFQKEESERTVFANVSSVSMTEWFEGGRNGLNPEYRITMFKYDYQSEPVVQIGDVRYTIYRTYERRDDLIELYVQKRKGNE